METQKLKDYFSQITYINDNEWKDFEHKLSVVTYNEGDIILREGQICNKVHFINSGIVRVYKIDNGLEKNRTFFMSGFFATEYLSFITRKPSKEYLQVIKRAELVVIDYKHLNAMFDTYKNFERLGRLMAELLYQRLRVKIERYQNKSPEERYKEMLVNNPQYLDNIPHYHLASYLGIKPQSLSRIRKRLK